jgi:hypothetical protein
VGKAAVGIAILAHFIAGPTARQNMGGRRVYRGCRCLRRPNPRLVCCCGYAAVLWLTPLGRNVMCCVRFAAREAMSAGRPRHGEALPMTQCVVCQINVSAGRRTHGPCVPTGVVCRFVARARRCSLWRLRETATPWRGPTEDEA